MNIRNLFIVLFIILAQGCNSSRPSNDISEIKKSCMNGDAEMCLNIISSDNPDNESIDDIKSVAPLLEHSCESEPANRHSCEVIGSLYHNGDHIKTNFKKAQKYLYRACKLGENIPCRVLFMYVNERNFFSKQSQGALQELTKFCDQGDGTSCYIVYSIYLKHPKQHKDKYKKANFFLRKSCDNGFSRACTELQWLSDKKK